MSARTCMSFRFASAKVRHFGKSTKDLQLFFREMLKKHGEQNASILQTTISSPFEPLVQPMPLARISNGCGLAD